MPVVTLEELDAFVADVRASRRTIALANGVFDLLHVGHVRYLQASAAEADCLIVAVNADASVRRLKGEGRPIVDERGRARWSRLFAASIGSSSSMTTR